MRTYKRLLSSFLIFSISVIVFSQNNTNSPYTRYGYGKLADQSFGQSQSMGGIGYGLRTRGQINALNPASYSQIDSLTFLFDFGLMGQWNTMSNGTAREGDFDGNFTYLSMQYRLVKRLGMSFGLKPLSYVGYDYGNTADIGDGTVKKNFNGTGSLSQVYGGLGYELLKNRLSLGVNVGFTFGSIERNLSTTFPESSSSTTHPGAYPVTVLSEVSAHDFFWETGLQYTHPIGKKDQLTIGAVFSPKQKFAATNSVKRTLYDANASTIVRADTFPNYKDLYMPMSIGGGFSYVKNNQLTFGADVLYQKWTDVAYPGSDAGMTFNDRIKYSGGIEYVKNPNVQRGYLKRIRYRLGGYYSNSYVDVNNSGIDEFGITAGFGLPFRFRNRESMVNIGAEYIKIIPQKQLIDEQYFRVTVGVTFNELWFRKHKFD